MAEEQKLREEIQELYAEPAGTSRHDPYDRDISFVRRCLVWCLQWRLAALGEGYDNTSLFDQAGPAWLTDQWIIAASSISGNPISSAKPGCNGCRTFISSSSSSSFIS